VAFIRLSKDPSSILGTSTNFMRSIHVLVMSIVVAVVFAGCATTYRRGGLPTTRINGTQYVALTAFCDARSVAQSYDQLTRVATLSQAGHQVRLVVGDTFYLVDGKPYHLKKPVEYSQGDVYIPDNFRQQVLDDLFVTQPVIASNFVGFGKIKKVVIDAGHGGRDPGAIGRTGLREKEVTLDIAKRLDDLLRAEGLDTTLVRANDQFVSLDERVKKTNNSSSSIFVSIHANANPSKNMRGFEVYYITPRISDTERALSSARNDSLNLNGSFAGNPSSNLKAVLWDMIYTYNRAESILLSKSLCKVSGCNLDTKINGIKSANYHVLRGATVPAVLIEVGFLSNLAEERSLKADEYRQRIAQSIRDGIKDFAHAQDAAQGGRLRLSSSER
jgi:N-acetylmuramoyl-L-alanine amidase